MDIVKLDNDTINKIAAGEVVERPASVVKELLENSIDAKASIIKLVIEEGGMQLIEVIDNGIGMNKKNADKAFLQHATSKINSIEDLEKISSLGFRGEALASISSVAECKLHSFDGKTKPVEVSSFKNNLVSEIGSGRNQGTTMTVQNIFDQIPARKKFLKTPQTEARYIQEVFINLAISNPSIEFEFIKDDKLIFKLKKAESVLDRILEIFKDLKQAKIIPVEFNSPNLTIHGYLVHPDNISRSALQFIFINERYVKDRLITKAIKDGFETSIPKNVNPQYFLFININPNNLDVNVHPRKLEVRFENPGEVFKYIKTSVNQSLENYFKKELANRFGNEVKQEKESYKINNNSQQVKSPLQHQKSSFKNFSNSSSNSVKSSIQFTESLFNKSNSLDTNSNYFFEETFNCLQILKTYILVEKYNKLLVIDQHAADERIKFDKLKKSFNNSSIETQELLIPIIIELNTNELLTFEEHKNSFKNFGIKAELFSKKEIQINSIPVILKSADIKSFFIELLQSFNTNFNESETINRENQEKVLATIACHGSIRAGQKLHKEEINKLISDLFQCDLSQSCPHGRPIIWEISQNEIEKKFKRIK